MGKLFTTNKLGRGLTSLVFTQIYKEKFDSVKT